MNIPEINPKVLVFTLFDGSKWGLSVSIIAQNRAERYASEYGGDVAKSLSDDTLPTFEKDPNEIIEWAQNHMAWDDVKQHFVRLKMAPPWTQEDFRRAWEKGEFVVTQMTNVS